MPKHAIRKHMWTTADYMPWYDSGSVMHFDITCGLAALPTNDIVSEECWNFLDQHPETMGFEEPSFRVPGKGTRLNPVDAYSADGDLYPLDNQGYLRGIRRGVYHEGGRLVVGCVPGDIFYTVAGTGEDYRELVVFSGTYHNGDIPGRDLPHPSNGWCGWYMYWPDEQLVTAHLGYLFRNANDHNNLLYASALPSWFGVSAAQWKSLRESLESAISWCRKSGVSWTFPSFQARTITCVENTPAPTRGYFDDLVSVLTDPGWEQMARDAYNSIDAGFDGNGIALCSDLTHSVSSAKSTALAIRNIGSKNKRLKAAANTYLSFRYGWKLLMSDVKSLSASMKRSIPSRFTRCTSQKTETVNGLTVQSTYQVFYDKYGGILGDMSALDQLTSELDLEMSLGNAWDMVKYSFVLDWFADVGSVLESMDSFYNVAYRYDVICCGKSQKASRTRRLSSYGGSISEVAYRRRYEKDAIPPSPLPATRQPRSQSWIDGAALVVQRI